MPEHIARKSLSHCHLHRIEPKFGTMWYCWAARHEPASGRSSPISCPILAKTGNFLLRKTVIQLCAGLAKRGGCHWISIPNFSPGVGLTMDKPVIRSFAA